MMQRKPAAISLTFYTKNVCPLCDELLAMMQPIIDHHQEEGGAIVELSFVDITKDGDLYGRYRFRIPVVLFEEEILFEGRPDQQTVVAALQSILVK